MFMQLHNWSMAHQLPDERRALSRKLSELVDQVVGPCDQLFDSFGVLSLDRQLDELVGQVVGPCDQQFV